LPALIEIMRREPSAVDQNWTPWLLECLLSATLRTKSIAALTSANDP